MKRKYAAFMFFAALAFQAQAKADVLRENQSLGINQILYSANHHYYAIMQSDGNFVVYKNDGSGTHFWNTKTAGSGAVRAVMQNDGNFVLYTANGAAVWASYAYGRNNIFYVDDYGYAVIEDAIPTWKSGTGTGTIPPGSTSTYFPSGFGFPISQSFPSTSAYYRVVFQGDGNFVLYKTGGVATWNSRTNGMGATTAVVSAGDLDLLGPDGIVWQAPRSGDTYGYSADRVEYDASYMVLTADGDFELWAPVQLWKSTEGDGSSYQAPGGNGPGCYGPPEDCYPAPIPIYSVNY